MMNKVTLVDYGMCNLLNVARAFEYCGADVNIIEKPGEVKNAIRLVVPGVGAFEDSMREVNDRGFGDEIKNYAQKERPLLGICVGMQMLFDSSEEFGMHAGLSVLPGIVKAVPDRTSDGSYQKVPHIGWNHLVEPEHDREWENTLLAPLVQKRPAMYFVHSFSAQPVIQSDRLADCMYGGHRICAAVQRNNIMATQFHPERSGELGLRILKNFIKA